MNTTTLRLRYTQFLVVSLLGILLYMMSQSLSGGINQFESNLWGHEFLITSFTKLKLKIGDRVFPQVLVGKEGWLELTSSKNLDNYQNAAKIQRQEIKNTQSKFEYLYKELSKRNISLFLIIPPNKVTIYPDKLPNEIQKIKQHSKLDMFAAYVQKYGPPGFIDLRPALRKARKSQDVYYKTDTHWNAYGTFTAYREIIRQLSKAYPQLSAKSLKDFQVSSTPSIRDTARIMGTSDWLEPYINFAPKFKDDVQWVALNEDRTSLQVSITPTKNAPTLLMYVDSFGLLLKDFLSWHFSKATYVLFDSKDPDLTMLKMIDATKPDIVIIEMLERRFYYADFQENIVSLDDLLSTLSY